MSESMSPWRSVSTRIQALSTRRMVTRARVTTPVSPMPPALAQKSSGSASGPASWTPVGVLSVIADTWRQKLPSRWWFLPWTSAAIAPPTVTCRVPGDTGMNHPSRNPVRNNRSRLTPAPTSTSPLVASIGPMASRRLVSRTRPPAHWAASP